MAANAHADAFLLLLDEGNDLYKLGRPEAALVLYLEGLAQAQRVCGEHAMVTANFQGKAALVYSALGNSGEALRLYESARATYARAGATGHDVAALLANMAMTLSKVGRHDEALTMQLDVVHMRSAGAAAAAPAADPRQHALALQNLAETHSRMGDHACALQCKRDALAALRSAPAPDAHAVALALMGVGNSLAVLRQWDEASEAYAEALELLRRRFGDAHPIVAKAMHNAARVLLKQGREDEASAMGRDALGIAAAALGPDHPETEHYRTQWDA